MSKAKLKEYVQELVDSSHGAASKAGWWDREKTWETVPRCLMLIVSEIAEAMEGDRKNLMDDKLPHRAMIEVELADAMIRIADLAGALNLDLGGAIVEKLEYNATRPDHKKENRKKVNGKSY
jgi:NTP pyrophosphatase (non-canonical NTP hydrolase)